ncbi:MAG: hypothetical protein LBL57_07045 [Tannerella sp.]|jgi:hypothetical protein|nr:hypothetical protein [Tannerella sp.]
MDVKFIVWRILIAAVCGAVLYLSVQWYLVKRSLLGNSYIKKYELDPLEIRPLNHQTRLVRKHFALDFCVEAVLELYLSIVRELPDERKADFDYNIRLIRFCVDIISYHYGFVAVLEDENDFAGETYPLIVRKVKSIRALSEDEERALFKHDSGRRERLYRRLTDHFEAKDSPERFYAEVCALLSFGPSMGVVALRNFYYRSYHFMVGRDKRVALKFYLQYLHVKSASDTFKHNAISKRNASKLFGNEEREKKFDDVCQQLRKDRNLERALKKIEEVFLPVRRKISLNVEQIREAKTKQNKVAQLLGAYLNEEEPPAGREAAAGKTPDAAGTPPAQQVPDYKKELLDLFISRSFRLSQQEIDIFATSKGLFRDRFIESINEQYYELLDDLLIEEDGAGYVLNEDYYQQIAGKEAF